VTALSVLFPFFSAEGGNSYTFLEVVLMSVFVQAGWSFLSVVSFLDGFFSRKERWGDLGLQPD